MKVSLSMLGALSLFGVGSVANAAVTWTDVSCALSNSDISKVEFVNADDETLSSMQKSISYNAERGGSGTMRLISKDKRLQAEASLNMIPRSNSTEIEALLTLGTQYGVPLAKSRSRMHFAKDADVSNLYQRASLYLITSEKGKYIELKLECEPKQVQ